MAKQRLIVFISPERIERLCRGPEVLSFPNLEVELQMGNVAPADKLSILLAAEKVQMNAGEVSIA